MADPFLGEIIMFGGNFAPRGWALCDGQRLPISQNSALFSLLGTTYGGDGRTDFALPDLRGRVPMHAGTGPGLSSRALGAKGGVENVTLTVSQIPTHNHTITVPISEETADQNSPSGNYLAEPENDPIYHDTAATGPGNTLGGAIASNTGGGQDHDNMQPWLTVNFIIALQGVFPSRS